MNRKPFSLISPQRVRYFGETLFTVLGMRRRHQAFELGRIKKVVVVKLDELGDVVLCSPFLRELRRNLPDASITLVVKPAMYGLVERCPYVNRVLSFDRDVKGRFRNLKLHLRAIHLARREFWGDHIDCAIVPRWDADYYHASFVAYFSGAVFRAGYSEQVIGHKRDINRDYDLFFTHALQGGEDRHEIERNLDLLRYLGGTVVDSSPELWTGSEDDAFASAYYRKLGVRKGATIIAIGPSGGNSPLKQWPLERFIELGSRLIDTFQALILVVGGPGEEGLGESMLTRLGANVMNPVGQISVLQMAALLRRCNLFIGNDAGPAHVAAALGIPSIVLFGPSCRHRFRPWGDHVTIVSHDMPCGPCSQRPHRDRCGSCSHAGLQCMLAITVDEVMDVATRMVSRKSPQTAGG